MHKMIIAGLVTLAGMTASACGRVEAQGQTATPAATAQAERQVLRDAATLGVFIDLPQDAVLTSPMRIAGTADSGFFNEGVFPVRLLGANGCLLGEALAMHQGEWMKPGQVDFEATLVFDAAPGSAAILAFEQDIAGEDPLPPLAVTTRVTIAGVLDPDRANPDPEDCAASFEPAAS